MLTTPRDNLLVLRSMTKAQALAGVRLGYAVGHPEVMRALALVRPPWNVNALAQAAGIAALQDQAHMVPPWHNWHMPAKHCCRQFARARCGPILHAFSSSASARQRRAAGHSCSGILVRRCTSFGLPEYIRVATRRPEENARLLAALAQVR